MKKVVYPFLDRISVYSLNRVPEVKIRGWVILKTGTSTVKDLRVNLNRMDYSKEPSEQGIRTTNRSGEEDLGRAGLSLVHWLSFLTDHTKWCVSTPPLYYWHQWTGGCPPNVRSPVFGDILCSVKCTSSYLSYCFDKGYRVHVVNVSVTPVGKSLSDNVSPNKRGGDVGPLFFSPLWITVIPTRELGVGVCPITWLPSNIMDQI